MNTTIRTRLVRGFLLTVVIATALCTGLSAQEQTTSAEAHLTPKFGIKGGVNLTNLYVDDVQDKNMKAGLNAGFFAKLPVTRGLSIQPELLYSSKGSKLTYNNAFISGAYRFNLNYIEMPVLAVINIARNFNIHAGGYAAYLASANIKQVNDNGTTDEVVSFNEDNFNRFDYGLAGGLGFDIEKLSIGARYNYGLNNVGDKSSLSTQALKNSKNSAISLYLGLAF